MEKDEDEKFIINGVVYFTNNCEERGIKNKRFNLEGVMKVDKKNKLILSNPCRKKK